MRKDEVTGLKLSTQLFRSLKQSFVIGNEYLDVVANPGYFASRPQEIRNRTWRSVPNVNRKSFPAQVPGYATADNSKPDYTDVFARCMGHRLRAFH
jgi:hypothetical protein